MLTRVSHNEKNDTYIQIIAHTIVYKSMYVRRCVPDINICVFT